MLYPLPPASCHLMKYGCSQWSSVLAHKDPSLTLGTEEQQVGRSPGLWGLLGTDPISHIIHQMPISIYFLMREVIVNIMNAWLFGGITVIPNSY